MHLYGPPLGVLKERPMAKRVKKLLATTRRTVSRGKSEHSRIINAARNSDTSIKRLADKIPAAIFIFQGNKNRFVNFSAEALTGYTRKELL
jgi:PAS domain-containing protein